MVRFMGKVNKTGTCWLWTGVTAGTRGRYGYFQAATKQSINKVLAHRWIYTQVIGDIPDGMEIDHLCRNKMCVNPQHLEPVTPDENKRRARLDVCRSGRHDLTDPENVRWDNQGRRRGCLSCWHDRARERAAASEGT